MAKIHGQLDGRQARLEQTASWLGATPVDVLGRSLHVGPTEGEIQLDKVSSTVTVIREALQQVERVQCTEMHKPNVDAIRELLSPEELARVTFDFDEMAGGQAF